MATCNISWLSVLLLALLGCFGGILGHAGDQLQAQNETFSSMADHKLYIVYMRTNADEQLQNITAIHLQLLHDTLGSAERAHTSLIYSYKHAMNGFSALLTDDHVKTLAAKQGVIQIVPSQTMKPLTTNSWSFLDLSEQESVDIASQNPTIIGVLDTGVNPELPSFSDDRVGPVPTRWNGKCDGGPDFLSSYCNRKLIGVRYYVAGWIAQNQGALPGESMNAFDTTGHGTHVATTAGGEVVANVQVLNGLVGGAARGGNPLARLAMYKVFWVNSVGAQSGTTADFLQAMEDAIIDGVDIINLSLGFPFSSFLTDPISVASFYAMRRNILTVHSAGNSGPEPSTTHSAAPWTITVAATTTNRDLLTAIHLRDYEDLIPGFAAFFLQDMPLPWYDLVSGQSIQATSATIDDATHCRPGSLDPTKAAGRIVFCKQAQGISNETSLGTKIGYLWGIHAAATIVVDDTRLSSGFNVVPFPFSIVSSLAGSNISNYIQDSITPEARILQTQAYFDSQPAPAVAGFSSRGPNSATHNILKPDIAAPGAFILAGGGGVGADLYGIMSGTSMAAPHVSGVASLVRAYNGFDAPWSSSAIKSALMTTASTVNSMGTPIMIDAGTREANPFDYGSGNMKPLSAINKPGPGLIYDADVMDYVKFLCYMGYSGEQITYLFQLDPLVESADCLGQHNTEMISQINLPSIAITQLRGRFSIQRTLTNVGAAPATYYASIFAPAGVQLTVTPGSLLFSTPLSKNNYTLHFQADPSSILPETTPRFGSITWSDGFGHDVRSPIVIESVYAASNMHMQVV